MRLEQASKPSEIGGWRNRKKQPDILHIDYVNIIIVNLCHVVIQESRQTTLNRIRR